MDELSQAFSQTMKIVLGAALGDIHPYSDWLSMHIPLPYPAKSMRSGQEVWLPPPRDFLGQKFDAKRVVSMDEGQIDRPNPCAYDELQKAGLDEVRARICAPIAIYLGNFRYKTYQNTAKTSGAGDCVNVYMSEDIYHGAKNIAFCKSMLYSENVFGCREGTRSKYCIKCYGSHDMTRCFECDSCTKCSDSYFCHNCENLENCMFCFNVKGKRYAIGNVEMKKEEYLRIKKMVLAEIAQKLEKDKKLDLSIYSVGAQAAKAL